MLKRHWPWLRDSQTAPRARFSSGSFISDHALPLATKGALDDTMQGKRSGDAMKEVVNSLKAMSTSGLDKETTAAIQIF
jgi:hypothetical protein